MVCLVLLAVKRCWANIQYKLSFNEILMKKIPLYLLLAGIIISVLAPALSYSDVQYTFLKDCKDIVNNDNAAFSELSCPSIAGYQVSVTEQSPQFFNIILSKAGQSITSDFTFVSKDNPIAAGKAIEWHVNNNAPEFMIFRLSWGSNNEPFKMNEHLVVNLVTDKNICVLATIDVKKNKKSNQKARDLVAGKFKNMKNCPRSVLEF